MVVEAALVVAVVAAAVATFLALFAFVVLVDGCADVYARMTGGRPGLACTRFCWGHLRAGPLTRVLGPPPLRVAAFWELLALSPAEFERACGRLLQDRGYRHVQRVGGPGDLALDLTARDPDGRSVAV